ncbi:alkane 1-monooxygenase [Oceaniglobus trochenteri]|uniref:alkane 1-monooxygenase n=1 Tax=Oceaniglobus trochenteri TaxID=2763260 RepID=UPI001D000CCC|nr:alkane 1-monooxygenase [Oceaniglobus trochenteri]
MTVKPIAGITRALPFWLSLALLPVLAFGAVQGGWSVLWVPVCTWFLFSIIDVFAGLDNSSPDPQTPDAQLFWYRLITLVWFPLQCAMTFGLIWYASHSAHLGAWEKIGLFFGIGVINGTIGITYAHELMHQKSKVERWMADLLLAMVFYSHFRSEHLLVHHRYVATPRDPVTARYNEGFHRYFPRVLVQCLRSSWNAEAAMLGRKGLSRWHRSNPFWRYGALQAGFVVLALLLGGWGGLALLLWSGGVAIWQLELVNYVEHYGLTRRHLGGGKYEHVLPRHSWNASHRASNWLLINLQRHSDHHYKPDRRFPLLQTYDDTEAPQLPHGYPVMTTLAMIPPLWRRRMNPRVRQWRRSHYPDITDWQPYSKATNPLPR